MIMNSLSELVIFLGLVLDFVSCQPPIQPIPPGQIPTDVINNQFVDEAGRQVIQTTKIYSTQMGGMIPPNIPPPNIGLPNMPPIPNTNGELMPTIPLPMNGQLSTRKIVVSSGQAQLETPGVAGPSGKFYTSGAGR